jgi:branched-subunit amino acid ABC-type transport system permease component
MVIALLETMTAIYLPFRYVAVVLYGVLIVALWIRTEGLAGVKVRRL